MAILKNIDSDVLGKSEDLFNFSPSLSDELLQSVSAHGILVRPGVCYCSNDTPLIIFGHNRIEAAAKAGAVSIEAEVFERDQVLNALSREFERKRIEGSLAPFSLLMLYNFLQGTDFPGAEDVQKSLPLPAPFRETGLISSLLGDKDFGSYALEKKLGMKIIRSYAILSGEGRELLNRIIAETNPRMNILKEIIQLIDECLRSKISIELNEAVLENENSVVTYLKKIRYPLYQSLCEEAEQIKESFRMPGVSLSFPPYFEGGFTDICCRIKGEDDSTHIKEKFEKLSGRDFKQLLDFLKGK